MSNVRQKIGMLAAKSKSFLSMAVGYWFLLLLLLSAEYVAMIGVGKQGNNDTTISELVWMLFVNNFAFASLCLTMSCIFYLLFIKWQKIGLWVSNFLLSCSLLAEAGLAVYARQTGLLLGAELFVRPVSETMATIQSYIAIGWLILIVLLAIGCSMLILHAFAKIKLSKTLAVIVLVMIISGWPLLGFVKEGNVTKNLTVNNFVKNKTLYCLIQYKHLKDWESLGKVQYDEHLIKGYLSIYPDRQVADMHYPLERRDNVKDVLSPFFQSSNVMPNVVYIVMESLGREWSGENEGGISFTPFFDSLATEGLYWTNCLSTTPRSFGVVPALIGSVPYGVKGFQFGAMPDNYSLITLLKNNGYSANAFYAGDFAFDCVKDYLDKQKTDFYAPLNQVCWQDTSANRDAFYFGYNDSMMFRKSLDYVEAMDMNLPRFELYITLSAHEDMEANNDYQKNKKQRYERKIMQMINSMPADKQKVKKENLLKLASLNYADDCLRDFFARYSHLPSFQHTIFVITGDHASGRELKNDLSYHHVPLVIWSPLLQRKATFHAVVSHNDVTPSLVELLKNKYGLQGLSTVHWIEDGLDTIQEFSSSKRMLFMSYAREFHEMLFDKYYYYQSDFGDELYQLDSLFNLKSVENQSLKNKMRQHMQAMKYIHKYVYLGNQLTKNSSYANSCVLLRRAVNENQVHVASVNPPSEVGVQKTALVLPIEVHTSNYTQLKVVAVAKVLNVNYVYKDNFMNLQLECNAGEHKNIVYQGAVCNSFLTQDMQGGKWNDMKLEKVFSVPQNQQLQIEISVATPEQDDKWDKDNELFFNNIEVEIYGIK